MGILFIYPPTLADSESGPGVDAVILAIRSGVLDVDEPPLETKAGGLDGGPLKFNETARDIDARACLHHDRFTRTDRNLASRRRELAHGALNDPGKSGRVGERSAEPIAACISAFVAEVHRDLLIAQDPAPLQGRAGQLRPAEFEVEDVLKDGGGHPRGTGHIDERIRVEVDLSGRLHKAGVGTGAAEAEEAPFTGIQTDAAAGCL